MCKREYKKKKRQSYIIPKAQLELYYSAYNLFKHNDEKMKQVDPDNFQSE